MNDFCSENWERKIQGFLRHPTQTVKSEVQDHIRTCQACKTALDEQLGIRKVFKVLPDAEPGEEFDRRLSRRIQFIKQERNRPVFRYFEVFNIFFTIIIGAMIVVLFFLFSRMADSIEKKKETPEPPRQEVILPD